MIWRKYQVNMNGTILMTKNKLTEQINKITDEFESQIYLPPQAKIVNGSWACTCPCSCSKHNRFSLATPMKFGNFAPYFMLFMPTIIVTSCTVHALFMPSSCMFMAWTGYDMNKGFNPTFHAHESYSHAHEVMPLLHAHKPLLRDQKHEQSLFMGMN